MAPSAAAATPPLSAEPPRRVDPPRVVEAPPIVPPTPEPAPVRAPEPARAAYGDAGDADLDFASSLDSMGFYEETQGGTRIHDTDPDAPQAAGYVPPDFGEDFDLSDYQNRPRVSADDVALMENDRATVVVDDGPRRRLPAWLIPALVGITLLLLLVFLVTQLSNRNTARPAVPTSGRATSIAAGVTTTSESLPTAPAPDGTTGNPGIVPPAGATDTSGGLPAGSTAAAYPTFDNSVLTSVPLDATALPPAPTVADPNGGEVVPPPGETTTIFIDPAPVTAVPVDPNTVPVDPNAAPTIDPNTVPVDPNAAPTVDPNTVPVDPNAVPTVDPNTVPVDPNAAPTVDPNTVATPNPAPTVAAAPADVSAANPATLASNTRITAGDWNFVLNYGFGILSNTSTNSFGGVAPSRGQWLAITLATFKPGGTPASIPDGFFVLKDAQNRVYDFNRAASIDWVNQRGRGIVADATVDDSFDASLSKSFVLLFDVPPDATNLVLFSRDNLNQGYVVR